MFCKHEWEMISGTVTESKFEHAMRITEDSTEVRIPHQMCHVDRKHIQVFTCSNCGRLKRFVEDI